MVHTVETYHTFTEQILNTKKRYGFKVVSTVWENIPFTFEKHPIRRRIKERAKNEVDLFWAVSERAKQSLLLEGFPEGKIRVLYPGVDLEKFRHMPKNPNWLNHFGIKKEEIVILFVGRFVWKKGIYDLIYAAKRVLSDREINIPVKFVFVGSGPKRKDMIKTIRQLGISSSVKLIGSFPYQDMPDIHNLADIFVLPSIPTKYWQEQFGYVISESMARGKPVVSTLTGSIPEIFGNASVLVSPGNYLELAQQIKELIVDSELRKKFGKKSREHAGEKFDCLKVSNNTENIYLEIRK